MPTPSFFNYTRAELAGLVGGPGRANRVFKAVIETVLPRAHSISGCLP